MKVLVTLLALSVFLISCKSTSSQSLEQGIKGNVLWLEGNFMPGPGMDKKGEPVAREIYIFEVLKANETPKSGSFYEPAQAPFKVISSNEAGEFSVDLPAGTYSLLSKEEDGLFANLMDGQGNINPVKVTAGRYTEVTFKIDYKAVY